MGPARVVTVPTGVGPARLTVTAARAPRAVLLLGHGVGGGVAAPDLVALAATLPDSHAVTVVRVEQPWRVAGRRVAPAPAVLDRAWRDTLAAAAGAGAAGDLGLPGPDAVSWFVGGRSAGARVAVRTAAAGPVPAAGVVALAFPLHPPGRPERSRAGELAAVGVPLLVVQGDRDPFGRPAEFPAGVDVRVVPGADHALVAARGAPLAWGEVGRWVGDWLLATR